MQVIVKDDNGTDVMIYQSGEEEPRLCPDNATAESVLKVMAQATHATRVAWFVARNRES